MHYCLRIFNSWFHGIMISPFWFGNNFSWKFFSSLQYVVCDQCMLRKLIQLLFYFWKYGKSGLLTVPFSKLRTLLLLMCRYLTVFDIYCLFLFSMFSSLMLIFTVLDHSRMRRRVQWIRPSVGTMMWRSWASPSAPTVRCASPRAPPTPPPPPPPPPCTPRATQSRSRFATKMGRFTTTREGESQWASKICCILHWLDSRYFVVPLLTNFQRKSRY